MPDLNEVKDFIETCPCPIFPEFVDRILQPIIAIETKNGKNAAQEYKEELIEEGIINEEE